MGLDKTLVLLKPDAVKRGMLGKILARFEEKGLVVIGIKSFVFDDALLREHYAHLADKPFFPGIAEYMTSDMTVALCIAGVDAVEVVREMVGVTNGRKAAPGTIRGDYSMSMQKNLIHASDSDETAALEVPRFFPEGLPAEAFVSRADTYYAADEL